MGNAVGTMSQRGRFHGWQKVYDAAAISLMSPRTAAFSFPSPRQGVQSLFRCGHKQSLLVFPAKGSGLFVFSIANPRSLTQICGWPQEPPLVNLLCFCGILRSVSLRSISDSL